MTRNELLKFISLAETSDSRLSIVRKYLFHGIPYVFKGKEDEYFEFRNRIANKFSVGFHDVFIVGSAKLGFSYHKKNEFDLNSDIDIVIVNEILFEQFYLKISEYQYQLDRQYKTVGLDELKLYNEFLRYLIKGWMRPDKLPRSFQINVLKEEWFDFFQSISFGKSEVGNYKVSAGLFKNYEYLEKYYTRGLEDVSKSINIIK